MVWGIHFLSNKSTTPGSAWDTNATKTWSGAQGAVQTYTQRAVKWGEKEETEMFTEVPPRGMGEVRGDNLEDVTSKLGLK